MCMRALVSLNELWGHRLSFMLTFVKRTFAFPHNEIHLLAILTHTWNAATCHYADRHKWRIASLLFAIIAIFCHIIVMLVHKSLPLLPSPANRIIIQWIALKISSVFGLLMNRCFDSARNANIAIGFVCAKGKIRNTLAYCRNQQYRMRRFFISDHISLKWSISERASHMNILIFTWHTMARGLIFIPSKY